MMDQTNDIFSHRRLTSRQSSTIRHREQISMIMVGVKVISSHHIRSSEHTLQCTLLLALSFTHVSIVVRIAKDYFSSANGHISETKTHIDHHLSLQWKGERERAGDMKVSKRSFSLSCLRRSYLCNFLSHIDEWGKPDTYQHPFASSFLIFYPKRTWDSLLHSIETRVTQRE